MADPNKSTPLEQLGDLHALADTRVARLAREVATRFAGHADEIARTMVESYAIEIPAYTASMRDQALQDDVHAVSTALVRCWLSVMSTGRPPSRELLDPVLEGVRRRAHQGIDLESVLRAYRVGIRVMWSEITSSQAWPHEGVMALVATWTLDFADRIATAVAGAYTDEIDILARERERRRSALLNVILSGPSSEPIDAPSELDRRHSVAVARVRPDLTLDELEGAGQRLEGAGALLWTVRHRSVVAAVAWEPGLRRTAIVRRLEPLVDGDVVVAIGLGGAAAGIAETRDSYAEAIAALRLAPVARGPGDVVFDFHEVAALAALVETPDRARRFAASVLEPLTGHMTRPWVVPTLEAYLRRQGRLKQAAADLDVHLNTVKYRLRELRPVLDPIASDGTRAATLLLALQVARALDTESPATTVGTSDPAGGLGVRRTSDTGTPLR